MKNLLTLIFVMIGLACHGAGLTVATTNGMSSGQTFNGAQTNNGTIRFSKGTMIREVSSGSYTNLEIGVVTIEKNTGDITIPDGGGFAGDGSGLSGITTGSLDVTGKQGIPFATNGSALQFTGPLTGGQGSFVLYLVNVLGNLIAIDNVDTNVFQRLAVGDGSALTGIQASSISGGTISTNQTVIINTSWTIGTLYTNTYGVPIYISDASVVGVEAGVVGNSTLIFSNQTSKIIFNQITAIGGIAGNMTNGVSMLCVSNGTVYGFFDGSSGVGNSVSVTSGKISYTPNVVIGSGGSISNLASANVFRSSVLWGGPTNTVTLTNVDYYFQASGNVSLTNIILPNTIYSWEASVFIFNTNAASSINVTRSLALSAADQAMGRETTNVLTTPLLAGKTMQIDLKYVAGLGRTNILASSVK